MARVLYYFQKAFSLLILLSATALMMFPTARAIERGRLTDDAFMVLLFLPPLVLAFAGVALRTTWGRWLAAGLGLFWAGFAGYAAATEHRDTWIPATIALIGLLLAACQLGREQTRRVEEQVWTRTDRLRAPLELPPWTLVAHRWALALSLAFLEIVGLSFAGERPGLRLPEEVLLPALAVLLIAIVAGGVLYSRRNPLGLFVVLAADLLVANLLLVSERRTGSGGVAVFFAAAAVSALITWGAAKLIGRLRGAR